MSIANVSIVGNLVRAPQITNFSSGKMKTTLMVAVNTPMRAKNGGAAADYYKVEVWDKFAQLVADRLDKGNQVTASGRLTIDEWQDKEGKMRITPTISASDIAFPQRPKRVERENSEFQIVRNEGTTAALPSLPENTAPYAEASEHLAPEQGRKPPKRSDDEDAEYTEEENERDDFGEPNRTERPAPTREHSPTPS